MSLTSAFNLDYNLSLYSHVKLDFKKKESGECRLNISLSQTENSSEKLILKYVNTDCLIVKDLYKACNELLKDQ